MLQLTTQQQEIASTSPASRQLVTAGPGTGKTHTLLARLLHLVDEAELSPTEEVLVLSFSRAAVREIRARLRGTQDDGSSLARRARVQTFDSFATALLAEIEPEGAWQSQNYEERIQAATRLLRENAEVKRHLSEIRHVLVDELQDLVGARDELVRAVLEATPRAGWTLFGDPAQGIYSFGVEDPELRKTDAWVIYGWLDQTFGDRALWRELTLNHRAVSATSRALAEQMKPIGTALNVPAPDYGLIKNCIEDVLVELHCGGTINDKATQAALRASDRQKTAILCRDNGEALMMSRSLWEQGIAHHLRRGATERALPSWIADVLGDYQVDRIAKESFMERCEASCPALDGDAAFFSLSRLARHGHASLDLELLARRIREGNVPDELCEQPDAPLTVSTVHRAKGLEFERVYVLSESLVDDQNPHWEEELRVWYVALTRPRKLLGRLEPAKAVGWVRKCDKTERWRRTFPIANKLKWKVTDFEVRPGDSHWLDPAGALGVMASAPETQTYIRQKVRAGDAVQLRLCSSNAEWGTAARYAIYHGETFVGVTGDEFEMQLVRSLTRWVGFDAQLPFRLEKLRVDAVDTVAGRPDTGRKHGLGERGLWLRVRVAGLAAFGWNSPEQNA